MSRLSNLLLAAAALLCLTTVVAAPGEDGHYDFDFNNNPTCTNGRLFVTESTTGAVRVLNLDNDLQQVAFFASPVAGTAFAYASESGKSMSIIRQGNLGNNYTDGVVQFFTSGLNGASPTQAGPVKNNFEYLCVRPIHHFTSYGQLAIFCDGFYTTDVRTTVNSTATWIQEAPLQTGTSAPSYFSWQLIGQQHGVAMTLAPNNYLHSEASPARVARALNAGSTPWGFVVRGSNGNELHNINNITDTHESCHDFHGEAHIGSTFAFGCDSATDPVHDGVLVLKRNFDGSYNSRKLAYPSTLGIAARTGRLLANQYSKYFIGNFGPNFILALSGNETTDAISHNLVLNITGSCGWTVENSPDSYVSVLFNTGRLVSYQIVGGSFVLFNNVRVYNTSITCTNNFSLVGGYGRVYILRRDTSSITSVSIPLGQARTYPQSFVPFHGAFIVEDDFVCASSASTPTTSSSSSSSSSSTGQGGNNNIPDSAAALQASLLFVALLIATAVFIF